MFESAKQTENFFFISIEIVLQQTKIDPRCCMAVSKYDWSYFFIRFNSMKRKNKLYNASQQQKNKWE